MKILTFGVVVTMIVFFTSNPLFSQYTFYKPAEGFGIELSLSNTTLKRLPVYRNSIASLIVSGDNIIGGTEAREKLSPYLFVASLSKREVVSTLDISEVVKGQRSIQAGFVRWKGNNLITGTIANKTAGNAGAGGHLLQVKTGNPDPVHITDLGVPVRGEGVYALAGDTGTNMVYGITYPSGIFFSYDYLTAKYKTYNEGAPTAAARDTLTREYHENPEDYLCSSLVVADNGRVYGTIAINRVFYFEPRDESFHIISDLPEVWGRRTLGKAEAWAKAGDGTLYGGNAGDGQLFSVDPASNKLKNLGKPVMMNRLRGLCFGSDGKLYGIAGALPGYAHLFSYDIKGNGFTDMGNPQFILKAPGIEQGIEWRGFQLRTITASEDGKFIVMGEDESLSQLLVLPVGN
jgi:hypothetical protein